MSNRSPASRRPVRPLQAGYTRDLARADLLAGATVAVLLVPQALAYGALAGLPPVTGLYTALGALVAYTILGGSPYVSAGPSAVTALLVAAAVGPIAGDDPATAVALAGLLALMAGGIRLLMGVLRTGGIINVVSHPVLTGFTAGAGVIIAVSQVPDLLGITAARAGQVPAALMTLLDGADTLRPEAAAVGLTALAALIAARRLVPQFPMPLLVVIAAAALTRAGVLDPAVVPMVGTVPRGLPAIGVPTAVLGEWRSLVPAAVVLALVGYVEGVSIAKSYALRDRRRIDPNRELVAHGAASMVAGLLGGFANGGSFSRSALAQQSGARTTGHSLVAVLAVAAALVLLPGALALVPLAVLAALVLYAVAGLFDVTAAREALTLHWADATGLTVAFVAPLLLGVDRGFLLAAVSGLLIHLYRGTLPRVTELGRLPDTDRYRNVVRWPDAITDPQVVLLRLDASLTFLNADAVGLALRGVIAGRPDVEVLILDLSGAARVDATGVSVLRELLAQAGDGLLVVGLANIRGPVRDALITTGLWHTAESRVHPTIPLAIRGSGMNRSPLLPE